MLHRVVVGVGAASSSSSRRPPASWRALVNTTSSRSSSSISGANDSKREEAEMGEPVADRPGFEFSKIGLLGGGRMAEAILAGVVKEELLDPSKIVVYDVNRERLDYLRKTFGISVASSVAATCNTDLFVVCVKPQNLPGVWGSMRKHLKPQSVLLSIVAGVPMGDFAELAGTARVVRTMPNTPATIQKGMTVWCCSDDVSRAQRDSVAKFLSSLGEQHFVQDESYLDMATAVSGSGPGYVLMILEALIDGSVHLGFSREVATKLVLQTVYGTTALAMKVREGKGPGDGRRGGGGWCGGGGGGGGVSSINPFRSGSPPTLTTPSTRRGCTRQSSATASRRPRGRRHRRSTYWRRAASALCLLMRCGLLTGDRWSLATWTRTSGPGGVSSRTRSEQARLGFASAKAAQLKEESKQPNKAHWRQTRLCLQTIWTFSLSPHAPA
jgi:pyrroline-5-carboxylate reductase